MDFILSILKDFVLDGDLDNVRVLIRRYDISHSRNWSKGYNLLCTAIENNRTEIAELLLTHGARVNIEEDPYHDTPLHLAVRNHNVEIVKMLLNRSANVNAKSRIGLTPLQISVNNGNIEITKLLLNQGADAYAFDKHGALPLDIAVEKGYAQIAEELLNHGINSPCTSEKKHGYTPLHIACELQNYPSGYAVYAEKIVKFLLSKNANINAVAWNNLTPLHVATNIGHDTIVKVLLEHGANVNAEDKCGKTVLYLAVQRGCEGIVKLLLEHGAHIDAGNKYGKKVLYLAIHRGSEGIVKLLLKHGANVNAGNKGLYLAIQRGSEGIVKLLLQHGANANAEDKYGKTVLYLAVQRGSEAIVKLLLEHGANVDAADKNGKTILLLAAKQEYSRISEHILKYKEETERMKVEKIGNSNVSFYDLLRKDINQLAKYLTNENIEEVLKSKDYKNSFPLYESILNKCFEKGVQRKHLKEQALKFFDSLLLPDLPYVITEKIFCYLSNADLRNLILNVNIIN